MVIYLVFLRRAGNCFLMKITLINISDSGGGAPVASMRLLKALLSEGVDAKFLVQKKNSSQDEVISIEKNFWDGIKSKFNFLYERLSFIFFHEKDKSVRFAFSTANSGTSIAKEPAVLQADILHLHWTNSGFLSINDLKELVDLQKPIVWTLHDMWAFTGGCHYAGDCDHFMVRCGNCFFLKNPAPKDLSYKGWLRKEKLYSNADNVTFVTCSGWLKNIAQKSALLKNRPIFNIPNPIDVTVYKPYNKLDARKKWNININTKIILFGAANINDRRKGIMYLVEALQLLKTKFEPTQTYEVVIFGKNNQFDTSQLPFKVYELSTISSPAALAELYSLANVFLMPSIEDNLPNTVMESLACGTPVVAFNTGGLPEMVDHKQNGYLANYKSAEDLANGIFQIINSENEEQLLAACRNKVLNSFTNSNVANQYLKIYKSLLN